MSKGLWRFFKDPGTKLMFRIILAILSVPVMLFVAFMVFVTSVLGMSCPFDPNPLDDMSFNARVWHEDATCSDSGNRRARISDDLLKHKLREGQSKKEVVALLGEGDDISNGAPFINDLLTNGHPYLVVGSPKWQERTVTALRYHAGQDLGGDQNIGFVAVFLGFDSNDKYVGGMVGWPGSKPVYGVIQQPH